MVGSTGCHSEIPRYLSMRFAGTLVVLMNIVVAGSSSAPTASVPAISMLSLMASCMVWPGSMLGPLKHLRALQ